MLFSEAPTQGEEVANAHTVEKNIKRLLHQSSEERLEAGTPHELKQQVGAGDMKRSCFEELLYRLKQQKHIRGFSLTNGNVYIQA